MPDAAELAMQNDGKFVCVTGTLTVIARNAHFRLTPPPPPGLIDPHNDKIFVWPFAEIQRRDHETGDTPTFCGRISYTGYHGSFDLRVTRWDQD